MMLEDDQSLYRPAAWSVFIKHKRYNGSKRDNTPQKTLQINYNAIAR